MIFKHVNLAFDPQNAGKDIKDVFDDHMARLLWLAIRQGHVITPSFHRNILSCAKVIKEELKKGKMDAGRLFNILSGFAKPPACGIIGIKEQAFAGELLPFVNGEENITFEIR